MSSISRATFPMVCRRFLIAACVLVLAPSIASAQALVLLQGYMGSAEDWGHSGIIRQLEEAGWARGGHLRLQGSGLRPVPGNRAYYTVELQTQAPLMIQLRQLENHLARVRERHPGEGVVLVGHSAGGVLGRLYMVQHPDAGVSALVSIASPHLGTESAEAGLSAAESPLGWLGSVVGVDALRRSSSLYYDLVRERPGTLLFWLNRQAHPAATYVSVVRDASRSLLGDLVVPEWSQDMNQVMALRGRALAIPSGGNHGLESADGKLLVQILRRLQQA